MGNEVKNIIIDHTACTLCLNCIAVCPPGILKKSAENSIEQTESTYCISCGHCAAVCPVRAISSHPENKRHPFLVRSLSAELPPEQRLFFSKRSIRSYKRQELDQGTIRSLIDYAELAPSGKNTRKREYYVVTDPVLIEELEKEVLNVYESLARLLTPVLRPFIGLFLGQSRAALASMRDSFFHLLEQKRKGGHPIFRGAPCIICIAAPKTSRTAKEDCTAAQDYMMLYGETIGLGSCIIGYAQYAHKKLEKKLRVSKGYAIFAVSIFGYPAYTYDKRIEYTEEPVMYVNAAAQ
jgi:nitroreductase/Pyruvate/2-oxoacid:ferredoxin oxidoreductase delta subunit